IVLLFLPALLAEQVSDHRDTRDERDALILNLVLAREQSADDRGAMVLYQHGGRCGPDGGGWPKSVGLRAVHYVRYFLVQVELDVVAVGHLRNNIQRNADVLPLDRIENLPGQPSVGSR